MSGEQTAARAALCLLVALAAACDEPSTTTTAPAGYGSSTTPEATEREVRGLLTKQAGDWTAGRLEAFCAVYSDDAVFVSPSGKTVGRAAIEARYHQRYREDGHTMGALVLEILDVRAALDSTLATATLRWTLTWPAHDGGEAKEPASGFSLVTLQRRDSGWQIVQDASM